MALMKMPCAVGSGEINYTDVVNFYDTMTNGNKNVTIPQLSKVKAVFFRYRTRPEQFYGWAVYNGSSYDINNSTSYGITAVNGNVVTVYWNAADILDFFALGEI